MNFLKSLVVKALDFLKVHGIDIVATYFGALATLVLSHTSSAGNGSLLSLVVAALLVTAKQFNAPAFVLNLLSKIQAKVTPSK